MSCPMINARTATVQSISSSLIPFCSFFHDMDMAQTTSSSSLKMAVPLLVGFGI